MPFKQNDDRARESRRKHYRAHPEPYKRRAKERKRQLTEWVRSLKNKPCMDCGRTYPSYVMHFDHRADKDMSVSRLTVYGSEKRIVDEIAKCDLVCANCHAERTHQRYVAGLTAKAHGSNPC